MVARALDTTQPLEYQPLLDAYGLQFLPADSRATRGWLGIKTKVDAGRLVVSEVQRDTPGAAGGLNVDDEILAIGDYRVRPDQWERRLDQYPPTTQATLLVARRDQLMRLDVTFGQETRPRLAARATRGAHGRPDSPRARRGWDVGASRVGRPSPSRPPARLVADAVGGRVPTACAATSGPYLEMRPYLTFNQSDSPM